MWFLLPGEGPPTWLPTLLAHEGSWIRSSVAQARDKGFAAASASARASASPFLGAIQSPRSESLLFCDEERVLKVRSRLGGLSCRPPRASLLWNTGGRGPGPQIWGLPFVTPHGISGHRRTRPQHPTLGQRTPTSRTLTSTKSLLGGP